ncbi:hypothetical protein, partial [Amycolatopsis sp. NPDC000740]|uniref:hypothetical protein n=1 Tax=Amycolatopsis sp. NPDC000740 TaxID=3154269 RepID=UPI00332428EB
GGRRPGGEPSHANQAFAAWLRAHAHDPGHVPEAVTNDSWPEMRWDRWVGRPPGPEWAMTVLDTSALGPEEVGQAVASWCRQAVARTAPVFPAGWFKEVREGNPDGL